MKKLLSLLLSVVTCLSICASCTSLKHEHITGPWEYNETQHWRSVTCTWNQCLFDLLSEDHIDENKDGICDVCGYLPVVPEHTTHTGEYRASEYSHWYVYTCGCPTPDIAELHVGYEDDQQCDICGYIFSGTTPTNYFLRNQAGVEWMNEITADDIAEIRMISEDGMVASGCFKDIASSTNATAIATLFEKYYWLDMWPVEEEDTIIMDGGVITVEFIMDNGAINRLTFNNGDFYEDSNGNHFELLYLPTFNYTMEFTSYHEFITYQENGTICRLLGGTNLGVEPIWLGELPMSEIKFTPVEISFGTGVFTPEYGITTDFGFLVFMNNDIFYMNGHPNYYYQLVGKNLAELMEEYCADSD